VADIYAGLESAAPEVVPQRVALGDDHAWVHWVARFEGVDRDGWPGLDRLGTKPYTARSCTISTGRASLTSHRCCRSPICWPERPSRCRCPRVERSRCRTHLLDRAVRRWTGCASTNHEQLLRPGQQPPGPAPEPARRPTSS
jgi:hypothetical protein